MSITTIAGGHGYTAFCAMSDLRTALCAMSSHGLSPAGVLIFGSRHTSLNTHRHRPLQTLDQATPSYNHLMRVCVCVCVCVCDIPSTAFRHLPPNSARFSYATEGALFIFVQLSTDAVSALRKVSVLIRLWKQPSAQART